MEKNNESLELSKIILDNLKDFLCVVFDENDNIIYPNDQNLLKRYHKIITNKTSINGIYNIQESNEWLELYIKEAVLNEKPIKMHFFRNISRFKRLEEELKTDFTGITNKEATLIKIDEYIAKALEIEQEFCVVLSDINYFKRINDTYGHLFGDIVLKNLGILINKNLRSNSNREADIAGRFGGDEFFGLIKNVSLENSIKWREKAKKIFKDYIHKSEDGTIELNGITLSIGMCHVNKEEIKKLKASDLSIKDIRRYIYGKCDENLYEDKSKDHLEIDSKKQKRSF